MKLSKIHVVEGDPEKGGMHVKELGDVFRINRASYIAGNPRPMLVLAAAVSLEEANAMRRGLVAERNNGSDAENVKHDLPENAGGKR